MCTLRVGLLAAGEIANVVARVSGGWNTPFHCRVSGPFLLVVSTDCRIMSGLRSFLVIACLKVAGALSSASGLFASL